MSLLRMDKYLADMGIGTRSEVKKYMKAGRVKVDGNICKSGEMKVDPTKQKVSVDGEEISYVTYEYYLLHKPSGVLSAARDPHATTVVDLISSKVRDDLFPVGRLDKDTEGLLLITNDGVLAHQLLSPKKHVDKTYYVELDHPLEDGEALCKAFQEGFSIGEGIITEEAKLEILPSKGGTGCALLTIHEGKFHQVKRMFSHQGYEVTYLKRISMGPLMLPEDLLRGEYRKLTDEEIASLKAIGSGGMDVSKN